MAVWGYISTFLSIIVGLAVADLLISFHRLIRVDAKVRWYWLVPLLAAYAILVIVNFWWGSFHWFANVKSLSMSDFVPTLVAAIALFLVAAAVLPDEIPKEGLDLKAWYVRNARQIWIIATISLSSVIAIQAIGQFGSTDLAWNFFKAEWDNWLLLAGFVTLIFVKRLWLHELIVVLAVLDMLGTAVLLRIG